MNIDLRGEECPLPTIKTVNALKRLKGKPETVTVVLDDAVCSEQIPYEARRLGYAAQTSSSGDSEWTIVLTPATS